MDKTEWKLVGWWVLLVALTALSFEGSLGWLGRADLAAVLVIVIAALKIRVVLLHFMEVRHGPRALRVPLEAWIIAITVLLAALWLVR